MLAISFGPIFNPCQKNVCQTVFIPTYAEKNVCLSGQDQLDNPTIPASQLIAVPVSLKSTQVSVKSVQVEREREREGEIERKKETTHHRLAVLFI